MKQYPQRFYENAKSWQTLYKQLISILPQVVACFDRFLAADDYHSFIPFSQDAPLFSTPMQSVVVCLLSTKLDSLTNICATSSDVVVSTFSLLNSFTSDMSVYNFNSNNITAVSHILQSCHDICLSVLLMFDQSVKLMSQIHCCDVSFTSITALKTIVVELLTLNDGSIDSLLQEYLLRLKSYTTAMESLDL
ncbi:hypothetical protein GEMRC1_003654 [Eukaryota sp. GEM-RC1]